jgi:RNA polymerase sigma-32 factor
MGEYISNVPAVPALSFATVPVGQDGLQKYIFDIRKYPLLSAEDEYHFACLWRDHQDIDAAHLLITSHLRLVLTMAAKYKGYGLPIADLISEGNIGLMQAVKKFDPDKGFRLTTYAMWWIRAAIQEYILRSWSLVKIGTTTAQKKLFFGLNKAKKKISLFDSGELRPDDVRKIAKNLDVSEYEVIHMNRRLLASDASLNVPIGYDDGGTDNSQMQDYLVDDTDNQEITTIQKQQDSYRHALLQQALADMPERDKAVIVARKLTDPPVILEELAQKFSVSRERIRQIESRAYETLKNNIQKLLTYTKPKLLK